MAEPEQAETEKQTTTGGYRRDEEFASLYANNIRFESSAFDLKLIFGELDQSGDGVAVEQHTAMTISWIQAKLLSYFLKLNIASYELENGKIKIPGSQIPIPFDPPEGELAKNPHSLALYNAFSKIRAEFIADLPQ